MFGQVSTAGVVVEDEKHGLVDGGPRRLDPEADRFRQAMKPVCPVTPTNPLGISSPVTTPAPVKTSNN
ncbi:MAG: hypothetical protein IT428_33340 [Planctomycetaceae bacterium]|nr:hypothetical protein [Planctomycetaceae bacterium]